MQGWLIALSIPGMEADTRVTRELWAASVKDEDETIALVQQKSGGTNVRPVIGLNDQTLGGLGIDQPGVAVRVKAGF